MSIPASSNPGIRALGATRPLRSQWGADGFEYPAVLMAALDSFGNVISLNGGEELRKYGFDKVIASGIDPLVGTVIATGSGQTVSQSAGNLVITAGTTINSETIIRLNGVCSPEFTAKINHILSQRNANNNFFFELVDVIGDGLAITIVSATSVTVTIPNNPFTAQNIGQSMYLGAYVGTGVFVPGRYAINAVAGNVVTFTVAGFTAGVGTCSAFGWNYHQLRYTGTTATNVDYDTQRNGWASGFGTPVTINTTAAPGHIAMLTNEQSGAMFTDATPLQSGILRANLQRSTRNANVPFSDAQMRLQIRAVNGTSAPTATTWTIDLVELQARSSQSISVKEIDICNTRQPLPVVLNNDSNIGTIVNAGTPTAPTNYFLNSAATTNINSITATTTGVQAIHATNIGATVAFVKLYNKASAPVLASDIPEMIITVPAAVAGVPGTASLPIGFSGHRFPLGLGIAITGAVADTDATAVALGQVKVKMARTA
jgi:hypothetical protein